MKTTLNIDDSVVIRLKREAARRRTMSELVEMALRLLFQTQKSKMSISLPILWCN